MKILFENWRRYQKDVRGENFNLTEERLDEVFGLPRGSWSMKDPEEGEASEYKEKADEAWSYLQKYTNEIHAAARKQGIEPEMLIGILMDEYIRMYPRALGDLLGYIGLKNTSMGIGQVKGETAKKISEKGLYVPDGYSPDMSMGELQRLIADDDEIGINYAAAYIRYVKDLWGEDVWAAVPKEEKNAILLTLYSHPGGEKPRHPGSEEWQTRGRPKPSERGTKAASAGRSVAQRLRHDVEE